MQEVRKKLENRISEKLKSLPADKLTAFFVEESEVNSIRAAASRIKRATGMEFRTEKAAQLNDKNEVIYGINIWKIKN